MNRQLGRYLVLVNDGVPPGRAAQRAFATDLDRALLRYVRRESFDSLELAIPSVATPEPAPVPRAEALTVLGKLSVLLDEW